MSRVLSGLTEKQRNASITVQRRTLGDSASSQNRPPIQFAKWLSKQSKRKDVIGSLARSVKLDPCWPQDATDYIAYRNHLRIDHSDYSITRIIALDSAWEEFAKFQAELLIPAKKAKS